MVEGHEPGKQRRFLIQARKLYEACHLSCQLSGVSGYDILTCYGSKLHHVGYPKFVNAAGDDHKNLTKVALIVCACVNRKHVLIQPLGVTANE